MNSAAFSFFYFRQFGAKQLAGGNCTIGKRELLEQPFPRGLGEVELDPADDFLASQLWPDQRTPTPLSRAGLWRLAAGLARSLQTDPEGPTWRAADEQLHQIASALYGLTENEHRAVFDWWRQRVTKRAASQLTRDDPPPG